jgi:hypothetical protein
MKIHFLIKLKPFSTLCKLDNICYIAAVVKYQITFVSDHYNILGVFQALFDKYVT